jgi:hypothetical protein
VLNSLIIWIAISGVLAGAFGAALAAAATRLAARLGRTQSATGARATVAAAGFLLFALCGGFVGSWLFDTSVQKQLDAQDPDIALLHRYDPGDYRKLVVAFRSAPSPAAAQGQIRRVILGVFAQRARQVDDAVATREVTLWQTEAKYLRDRDPASCSKILTGGDISGALAPDINKAGDELDEAIFRQLVQRPAPSAVRPSAEAVVALGRGVFAGLPPQEADLVQPLLVKSAEPVTEAEARAMCDYYIGLFGALLAAPKGFLRSYVTARG